VSDAARLDALFSEALGVPEGERDAFVGRVRADDERLADELEELLRAHAAAGDFLDDAEPWLGALGPAPGPSGVGPGGADPVPDAVSHYEIVERIGEGGMGVVFRARDTRLDRTVTLKFVHPHLGRVGEMRERFVQEARSASALDHPNICTIHEIDETPDGRLFMVMAYYEGETLKERLERGPLPRDEALRVARGITDGLARAHEAGIVHRDVKPANVMLTRRGEVKILDFGVAKLEGGGDITAAGTRVGTLAYMSPEQVTGEPTDHRSDIWALGVVLAEMLTGARPFSAQGDAALLHEIVTRGPELPAGLPSDLAGVIRRALARDPERRFASMAAFRAALEDPAAGGPTDVPHTRAGPLSRRRALAGVVAVAALALVFAIRPWRDGSAAAAPSELPRVAVLPFENLGPAEDEYFADGITDEVVVRLSRIGGLTVLARQSAMRYKGSDLPPTAIAGELGVEYLLAATVSWDRRADGGARVRVRPQLVRASDGAEMWTEVYEEDLTRIFEVQSGMAQRVAEALGVTLREPERAAVARRTTESLEAYDRFLSGNHFLLQRDLDATVVAIAEYRAAMEIDPTFADAQARIAYAYALFADHGWQHPELSSQELLTEGFEAVDRALELNPRSTDAWMARAYLLAFRNPDTYAGVAEAFEQAIAYDPNNSEAHHQYASMIGRLGLTPRVEALFGRALALEPGHAIATVNLAFFYLIDRRYDDALRLADSAVAINPSLYHVYEHRAQIRSHAGLHAGARSDAETAMAGTDGEIGGAVFALVTARAGDVADARAAVERELARYDALSHEGRIWLVGALVALGETDRALDLLAGQRDRIGLVYLRHLTRLPDFDPVREDPRFLEIVGG